MTRASLTKSKHGMTSEGRVRGAELASVLGYLYPFVEKAANRPRQFMAQTAGSTRVAGGSSSCEPSRLIYSKDKKKDELYNTRVRVPKRFF